jgi:hypothetical protein
MGHLGGRPFKYPESLLKPPLSLDLWLATRYVIRLKSDAVFRSSSGCSDCIPVLASGVHSTFVCCRVRVRRYRCGIVRFHEDRRVVGAPRTHSRTSGLGVEAGQGLFGSWWT